MMRHLKKIRETDAGQIKEQLQIDSPHFSNTIFFCIQLVWAIYLVLLVVELEAGEVQIPLQVDFGKFHEAEDLKYYVDMVILGLKQQILEV